MRKPGGTWTAMAAIVALHCLCSCHAEAKGSLQFTGDLGDDDTCGRFELPANIKLGSAYSIELFFQLAPPLHTHCSHGEIGLVEQYEHGEHQFPGALRVWQKTGRLAFSVRDGENAEPRATSWTRVTDDRWHHVVAVRAPPTDETGQGLLQLYVNGVLEGQAENFAIPLDKLQNNARVAVGSAGNTKTQCCFKGRLGPVRLYNRAMAFNEIRVALDTPTNLPGLIAAYDFSREKRYQTGQQLRDLSGRDNDADMVVVSNSPVWSPDPAETGEAIPMQAEVDVHATLAEPEKGPHLENNLEHWILGDHVKRTKVVDGHLFRLSNPAEFLSFIPPKGGCPGLHHVSETAADAGCALATNAAFFDTRHGACLGNIVSDGQVLQTAGTENVNFGITDEGAFVTGFMPFDYLRQTDYKFDQLATGMIWLVRDGKNVVKESARREDMTRQESGSADYFVHVTAPRLAIGYDKEGRFLLLQIDGDEQVRNAGVDLNELATEMLRYGAVNAVNLDGGTSNSVWYKGSILNTPMKKCSDFEKGAWGRCERAVASVLCLRPKARRIVDPDVEPLTEHHRKLLGLLLVVAACAIAFAFVVLRRMAQRTEASELFSDQYSDISSDAAELIEIDSLLKESGLDEEATLDFSEFAEDSPARKPREWM